MKYFFSPESPLRVCFTGNNTAGSWEMRGVQLASCRTNWTATHAVDDKVIRDHEVFCFVKRPIPSLMRKLKARGKTVVFDVIDSWTQPEEGLKYTSVEKAKELFREKWKDLVVDAFLFPNLAMMEDLSPLTPFSSFLYHHYRPEFEAPAPFHERAKVVGYEGNVGFLGEWKGIMERLCAKRSLEFRVSPRDIREVDIGFAARGGEHDSFLANRYKSNVKLANFYGAGIPCLLSAKEQSYQETDCGSVLFFRNEEQLADQLDRLLDSGFRQSVRQKFLEARDAFHISRLADQLELFLRRAREISQ